MHSAIERIRQATSEEEMDYQFLTSVLQDYASPRDVLTRLVKKNMLIRVKKGIFVFGPQYSKRPYSLELLSNQIYGPSYLSREYALQHYGLIPEAVPELTAMTTKRSKEFHTPVGRFSYLFLNPKALSVGVTQYEGSGGVRFLIATKEKAVSDLLYAHKEVARDALQLRDILVSSYRMEISELKKLSVEKLQEIVTNYNFKSLTFLPVLVKELRHYA